MALIPEEMVVLFKDPQKVGKDSRARGREWREGRQEGRKRPVMKRITNML